MTSIERLDEVMLGVKVVGSWGLDDWVRLDSHLDQTKMYGAAIAMRSASATLGVDVSVNVNESANASSRRR
jgi:hypothetical protein